jgi:DNA-binding PadR family transcriptional regulator
VRPVERGLSAVEYRVLQAVHDLSAGMPTVDVTQAVAGRKAGLDPESEEIREAMAALMDSGYVKGTNVLGQKVYRITASGIERPQDRSRRRSSHRDTKEKNEKGPTLFL